MRARTTASGSRGASTSRATGPPRIRTRARSCHHEPFGVGGPVPAGTIDAIVAAAAAPRGDRGRVRGARRPYAAARRARLLLSWQSGGAYYAATERGFVAGLADEGYVEGRNV